MALFGFAKRYCYLAPCVVASYRMDGGADVLGGQWAWGFFSLCVSGRGSFWPSCSPSLAWSPFLAMSWSYAGWWWPIPAA
ncbi:hypothetical protein MCP1_190009 [Candidatus Terasakiella magnetica]|nr:hypothetical protein MCP1_190009 [Candidatus Terasakiella magnetica]